MNGSSSRSSDDIILTDKCSKSNKKIRYIKKKDSQDSIEILKSNITSWNFLNYLNSVMKEIFLPKGYPDSVSSDYLEYQIWDTCQAFCSSISGTLAMRAVMQGIGVGQETATPVSAAITWIMKDGTGMVGSILFAWLKGSKLDSDCKKWRLFADILNDIAMFVELYVPFVMDYSMYALCVATALKALVGTAGSSTRAALITHQAIKGNIADVSAKDGSQEIFINLCAFIFGVFLLKNVTETEQIWTVMCTATLFHLIFNYKAVRCLKINVFNNERFCLSLRTYLPTSSVPTIQQINNRESVFLFMGISDASICGFSIAFGVSLKKVVETGDLTAFQFSSLVALFYDKKYFVMPQIKKKKLHVTFRQNFKEIDVLKAYFHSSLLAIALTYLLQNKNLDVISRSRKNSPIYRLKNILQEFIQLTAENSVKEQQSTVLLQAYMTCEDFVDKEFVAFCKNCREQGWNLAKHLINIDDWRADWLYIEENEENILKKSKNPKTLKSSKSPKPRKPTYPMNPNNPKMNALVIS